MGQGGIPHSRSDRVASPACVLMGRERFMADGAPGIPTLAQGLESPLPHCSRKTFERRSGFQPLALSGFEVVDTCLQKLNRVLRAFHLHVRIPVQSLLVFQQ